MLNVSRDMYLRSSLDRRGPAAMRPSGDLYEIISLLFCWGVSIHGTPSVPGDLAGEGWHVSTALLERPGPPWIGQSHARPNGPKTFLGLESNKQGGASSKDIVLVRRSQDFGIPPGLHDDREPIRCDAAVWSVGDRSSRWGRSGQNSVGPTPWPRVPATTSQLCIYLASPVWEQKVFSGGRWRVIRAWNGELAEAAAIGGTLEKCIPKHGS
ncbi:hypothetical protein F5Y07DRAFT_25877 [Xylaria sp. FL0933]|nr:hypothetical protein F5Y07DRAFT_25877 [Xylaria sp. FL0933]